MLLDFYENGEMDPLLILNHNTIDCYYSFLKKVDADYEDYLSEDEIVSLKFLSKNLANGKRPQELLILKSLIFNKYFSLEIIEKLLNDENDDSSTMYGYRIKHDTCPIFVTYDKKDDISDSTKYQDEFISKDVFSWMTRSRIKLDSKEVIAIKNYQETNLKIHLFIKKNDDEGKDFYYMGQVEPFDFLQTTIKNNEEDLPIVNIKYKLHNPVKDELYDYFEDNLMVI